MTRIGIVVAMAVECRSLTRRRVPEHGCLSLGDHRLVALAGAGPNAARRAAALLVAQGATALVSWGCAAALDPHLRPGDLVLPSRIVGADGALLDTSVHWRTRLAAKLASHRPVCQGVLVESSGIVATTSAKQAIRAATGAVAVDMESAAAARVASNCGLPFLAVRSIIDAAEIPVPLSVLSAFDEDGMLHTSKMLRRAATRPADFLGIIRLGWHFRAAMNTLRGVDAMVGNDLLVQASRAPQSQSSSNPNPHQV